METKFTKGPWEVTKDSGEISGNDGIYIGRVINVITQEGAANAHLIAAAPDLYEALVDVLDDLEIGAHPHLHIETIRTALAKARGETNE